MSIWQVPVMLVKHGGRQLGASAEKKVPLGPQDACNKNLIMETSKPVVVLQPCIWSLELLQLLQ